MLMTLNNDAPIHARIPSKIRDVAKIAASDLDVTFSSIVRSALEEYLRRHGYHNHLK